MKETALRTPVPYQEILHPEVGLPLADTSGVSQPTDILMSAALFLVSSGESFNSNGLRLTIRLLSYFCPQEHSNNSSW